MADARAKSPSWLDAAWQTVFRLGFPLARAYWHLRRPRHEGALVAIHVGEAVLLVRLSYRKSWHFPGGSVRRGESPALAARRELMEELGLTLTAPLVSAGSASGIWDGRRDRVHFFELRLDRLPAFRIDNREIVAARLMTPDELAQVSTTGPVAAYLARARSPPRRASARPNEPVEAGR